MGWRGLALRVLMPGLVGSTVEALVEALGDLWP